MEEIIGMLQKFSFSKMEATVYITLLQNPGQNGSQMAKLLGVPRSTAYSCLDGLYNRGAVLLIAGESNLYQAKDPDELLDSLKSDYTDTADKIKKGLANYKVSKPTDQYYNIQGYDNIVNKIKDLFNCAESEIYLNSNFDLNDFSSEIISAGKRGVRIVLFSFKKMEIDHMPIEYYFNPKIVNRLKVEGIDTFSPGGNCTSMLMVVDNEKVLIASGADNQEYSGTFTENSILVSTIAEHIHHDIYLLKLEDRFNKNLIDGDIKIGTMQEKLFSQSLDRLKE